MPLILGTLGRLGVVNFGRNTNTESAIHYFDCSQGSASEVRALLFLDLIFMDEGLRHIGRESAVSHQD